MNTVNKLTTKLLENRVYYGILALFLAIYGPRLHPRLPTIIKDLFSNNIFRFIVILLIAYISSEDLTISLMLAIAFLLFNGIVGNQEVLDEVNDEKPKGFSYYNVVADNINNDVSNGPEVKKPSKELLTKKLMEKEMEKTLNKQFAKDKIKSLNNDSLSNFDLLIKKTKKMNKESEKQKKNTISKLENFKINNVINFDKLINLESFTARDLREQPTISLQGNGVREALPGEKYKGQWTDGVMHGQGEYVYADGSRYKGNWKDGKPEGMGTMTFGNVNDGNNANNQALNDSMNMNSMNMNSMNMNNDAIQMNDMNNQNVNDNLNAMTSLSGDNFDSLQVDMPSDITDENVNILEDIEPVDVEPVTPSASNVQLDTETEDTDDTNVDEDIAENVDNNAVDTTPVDSANQETFNDFRTIVNNYKFGI